MELGMLRIEVGMRIEVGWRQWNRDVIGMLLVLMMLVGGRSRRAPPPILSSF
jgi:hypothetical protein